MRKYIGYTLLIIAGLTLIVWLVSQFIQPIIPTNINGGLVLFFVALLAVTGMLAQLKDATEFVQSLFKRTDQPTNPEPELNLFWMGDRATQLEGDCIVLEISKYNPKTFFLMLFVRNNSTAMATWYRLVFDIPRDLAPLHSEHILYGGIGEKTTIGVAG